MTRARPVALALAALALAFQACGDDTGTGNRAELPILPDFGMDPGDDARPDPGEIRDEGTPPDAAH
ncbi:MAG TPA: hypothetical protein PK313_08745, partial [Myxococcota bacterium]|nr:hypothetical protein [Myxococcota bacterium]